MEMVGLLINNLTKDEDLRQELWVHYLDTNSVDAIPSHFQKILQEKQQLEQFKANIWYLINSDHSRQISSILETCTPLERNLVCLVMLGFNISDISKMKGISQVRIKQTLWNLRYNPSWRICQNVEDEV